MTNKNKNKFFPNQDSHSSCRVLLHYNDNTYNASQPALKRKTDQVDPGPHKKPFLFNIKSTTSNEKPSPPLPAINKAAKPIKMSLGTSKPKETSVKPKMKVSSVFNQDDDSEEEEMPAEARMRMRNIGRDTPTASGPNSFGKDKLGFCDRQRLVQKQLQDEMDKIHDKEKK